MHAEQLYKLTPLPKWVEFFYKFALQRQTRTLREVVLSVILLSTISFCFARLGLFYIFVVVVFCVVVVFYWRDLTIHPLVYNTCTI